MTESWQDFIDSITLDNNQAPLLDNALYPLTTQGFLEVSGIDAAKFLQGQLSCDIQHITLSESGLGSHSNAKGRMQASFRICRIQDNSFLLRVPHPNLENAKSALSKYIIFSKATIGISQTVGIGLHGQIAKKLLEKNFTSLPNLDYQQHIENNFIIICTSASMNSYEIYTNVEQAKTFWPQVAGKLTSCNASQHQLLEHHLGLAFVEASTCNEFIPQMFNYQNTPAISFKKGCYTGQEIIARMHYRGNLKRHMRHYSAHCTTSIQSGEPVFIHDNEQSIGDIVSAVKTAETRWDLLINITNDAANNHELKTGSSILTEVSAIELPYTLSE